MAGYLVKVLYTLLFGLFIIGAYYAVPFHREEFSGYIGYLLPVLVTYLCYKGYHIIVGKDEVSFNPLILFGYFSLQLFYLCFFVFSISQFPSGYGIQLFFMILNYLWIPIIIFLICIGFGKFLLKYLKGFETQSRIFQLLSSLGVGFFSFVTLLSVLGFLGGYNILGVLAILLILGGISYREILLYIKGIHQTRFTLPNHIMGEDVPWYKTLNLYLLSSEFLFMVASFLISVSLISIVRPMPIGWDDLGVYMNYPNIFAATGSLLSLGGMNAWQTFTGIGYMYSAGVGAFFLNNFGGILAFLVIVLSTSDLLKSKLKTFFNIPLLLGTIFLSMPMVIFQMAKDMKLDPGLMFVSTIALYMTLSIFGRYVGYKNESNTSDVSVTHEQNSQQAVTQISYQKQTPNGIVSYFTHFSFLGEDIFDNKTYLWYIGIIGVLIGFAFSIKVTSLLLLSGILAIVFFSQLGVAGFLGYIFVYIGIFTYGKLWTMMNVVVPTDSTFTLGVLLSCMTSGLVLFGYALHKYGFKILNKILLLIFIILVGFGLGMSPWVGKNILTTQSFSISSILSGQANHFDVDYTKIYTQNELDTIRNNLARTSMTDSGTSTNEDLGRYFGYEKGVNNYLKLPYNLTLQSNQAGEYTDITFIYLALIPLILFLSYKSWWSIGVFIYLLLPIGFFYKPFNNRITDVLSQFTLPFGYVIVFGFFLIPTLFIIYTLKKDRFSQLFRLNLVFAMWYVFLWTISAFGIVWYGITMYYSILLLFGIGMFYVSSYDDREESKNYVIKFIGSLVVFGIVSVYFFSSSLPHGMLNLRSAGYLDFKAGRYDSYVGIFESQPNYFGVLLELNVSKSGQQKLYQDIVADISNPQILSTIQNSQIQTLDQLESMLTQGYAQLQQQPNSPETMQLKNAVLQARSAIYKNILYPSKDIQNTSGIYRIGTFFRYFITQNYARLLEDSLVTEFDTYIYDDEDIDIGIERMKKLGLKYFLVDLNAATIDRDPARNLTTRYENLLKTFTSARLSLIKTDSICLQLGLDQYNNSSKTESDFERYMIFAGVNYDSITYQGEQMPRGWKMNECYNEVLRLVQTEGEVNGNSYPYLLPIKQSIESFDNPTLDIISQILQYYISQGWFTLFEIQ